MSADESGKKLHRLRELSKAAASDRETLLREFTMRIPAEPDRDADLVLAWAADEIERLRKALDDLVTLKDYRDWHGKTPEYLEKKPAAWQQARDALARAEPDSGRGDDR